MVTVGEVSSTSPASKCQPGERSWPPANAHGTGLPRETPHTATERRSNRRWSSVLHKFPNPRCIHPTLSFPPWLPPRAYSQPSGMFFYRWCREELYSFHANWHDAVWAHGWKYLIWNLTLLQFLRGLEISMQMCQPGHLQSRHLSSSESLMCGLFPSSSLWADWYFW